MSALEELAAAALLALADKRRDEGRDEPARAQAGKLVTGNATEAPPAYASIVASHQSPGSGAKRPRQISTRACAACRRSKAKCTEERPCKRCIRADAAALCSAPEVSSGAASPDNEPPSKERRMTVAQSCAECRRNKVKCGDVKPCTRCIQRGLGDRCEGWRGVVAADASFADRPGAGPFLLPGLVPPPICNQIRIMHDGTIYAAALGGIGVSGNFVSFRDPGFAFGATVGGKSVLGRERRDEILDGQQEWSYTGSSNAPAGVEGAG
jgi:hypothetical protein